MITLNFQIINCKSEKENDSPKIIELSETGEVSWHRRI